MIIGKLDNNDTAIKYFKIFFDTLKDVIHKRFGDKHADQLPYKSLAIRDAINSLPCPINFANLKVDPRKYPDAESDNYYLIRYDFSKFGDFSVDFSGEFNLDDIQYQSKFLRAFAVSDKRIEDIKSLKLISYDCTEHWLWYWLTSQATLENLVKHANDFIFYFEFTFQKNIIQKFGREIDYVKKYDLQSDAVLSLSELLEIHKSVRVLFNSRTEAEHNKVLEDLQGDVSNIQLGPKVPDGVKEIFRAAKRLYIFGYFEYYFFTISYHYSLLALESALRNKYYEIFGKPKRFVNLGTVIEKLKENGSIREVEEWLYEAAKDSRNSLSHLVRPPVMMPSPRALERIAFLINQIFEDNKYK